VQEVLHCSFGLGRLSELWWLLLQEPLLLQLVLARAAQKGETKLLEMVLRTFQEAGWQASLGARGVDKPPPSR
jgi:hypothetical protein